MRLNTQGLNIFPSMEGHSIFLEHLEPAMEVFVVTFQSHLPSSSGVFFALATVASVVAVACWYASPPPAPTPAPPSPTPAPPVGGRVMTADLAAANLWRSKFPESSPLYQDLPETCFQERECEYNRVEEHDFHKSTSTLLDRFSLHFGVKAKFLGLTLPFSLGSFSETRRLSEERQSFFYSAFVRRACGPTLAEHCRYDPSLLSPQFNETLKRLLQEHPIGMGDRDSLEHWEEETARAGLSGTHVQVGTERGAQVKFLVSVEVMTDSVGNCFSVDLCQDLKPFLKRFDVSCDASASVCHGSQMTSTTLHQECSFSGGDPSASFMCDPRKWMAEDVDRFLLSGDPNSSKTIYRHHWEEVSEILEKMHWMEAAHAMETLADFRTCKGEGRKWLADETGKFACRCVLSCGTGRLLKESCTCACPGNAMHGWMGPTCSETYGKCMPGKNTGNPGGNACDVGNQCSCLSASETCKATEVCCLTDFNAKCCGFGHMCNCGGVTCECVPEAANQSMFII